MTISAGPGPRTYSELFGMINSYPTLGAGVTAVSGPNPWVLPAGYTAIVPVGGIAVPFTIDQISFEDLDTNSTYELFLYSGVAHSLIGGICVTRVNAVGPWPIVNISTPIIAANQQIDCRLASQGGAPESVRFTIGYKTY